jgi:hypothetical protein
MNDTVRAGDHVRVYFPPKHLCHWHNVVKAEGGIGVVGRLDDRSGDHAIVVVFNGLRHFGTRRSTIRRLTPSAPSRWSRRDERPAPVPLPFGGDG